jgi:signal transduction histidine kinase
MPAPSSTSRIQRLIGQLRWVTRISTALSRSVRVNDLYTIILSAVLAPDGLNYSRAFLFAVDRASGMLHGKIVAGPRTRNEARALQRELLAENEYLSKLTLEAKAADPEHNQGEALGILEDSAHWISLLRGEVGEDPDSRELASLRLSPQSTSEANPNLLRWAASLHRPRPIETGNKALPIPPPLDAMLAHPAAAVPLRTPKGLHGVLFVDRRFSSRKSFTENDLQELDWFALQAALAIENAELIEDLEEAFQQLKEVDTLKSNFLSILSHELRTPMTGIMGFVDLLLDERVGELTPNQRSLLIRVSKNSNHLLQIFNDLLEVSEVQVDGLRDTQLRPVDPLAVFFNTLPRLELRRRDTEVDIEPIIEDAIPRIICEARSLERILFHLLDNAVKFSRTGSRVQVEFRNRSGWLDIAVRDHGPGIAQDRLQRIFDSFYQVDHRLARSYEGLGLGLTVVRMLLQSTNGRIQVDSTPGDGSTFTISYPIAPA